MKLLADECCEASVVAALREDGHDVLYAAEMLRRLPDPDILERAVEEQRMAGTFFVLEADKARTRPLLAAP